ncbi:hypothetical protein N7520_006475 [Penicillium odoratum]|uniref:uncharacterized protein n=1 Tax=Penicillium odoratum TaxID=1167516 RepID=UPI002549A955|nr:uncharacterized protein N7520_006475 [Penicillium odoratum]KAJ5759319.1 hypothetical protein N7520_006475 [Penicillium odoratum]
MSAKSEQRRPNFAGFPDVIVSTPQILRFGFAGSAKKLPNMISLKLALLICFCKGRCLFESLILNHRLRRVRRSPRQKRLAPRSWKFAEFQG